mmetsp:Transcript_85593/g.223377  ORF Transcript_85593/g.223377 Transcript_85593/m.223377 type:complete len:219 (-) Transcript_85593:172-828(-)
MGLATTSTFSWTVTRGSLRYEISGYVVTFRTSSLWCTGTSWTSVVSCMFTRGISLVIVWVCFCGTSTITGVSCTSTTSTTLSTTWGCTTCVSETTCRDSRTGMGTTSSGLATGSELTNCRLGKETGSVKTGCGTVGVGMAIGSVMTGCPLGMVTGSAKTGCLNGGSALPVARTALAPAWFKILAAPANRSVKYARQSPIPAESRSCSDSANCNSVLPL